MNSYKIKTLQDILNAVDDKNIDGFLKDFEYWLRFTMEVKKLGLTFESLIWNDDGDNGTLKGVNVNITTKNKEKKA